MSFDRGLGTVVGAAETADFEEGFEVGKGREFVEQDKGPAVRHGIFGRLLNELAAFSRRRGS
jgi:hypothetical protein